MSADGNANGGEVDVYPNCGIPPNILDCYGLNIILGTALQAYELAFLHHLEHLLEKDQIARADKIEALELAGAVLLGDDYEPEKFPLAFQYWRRALTLRLMNTEDCRPIYKTPLKSKSGQLTEWSTLEDLQRIEQQPVERKMQSILVRLRIFSGLCWKVVQHHCLPAIIDFLSFGSVLRKATKSEILDLSWITLDTILRLDRPHERDLRASVVDFIKNLIGSLILCLHCSKQEDSKFTSENLQQFVELVLMTDLPYSTDPDHEAPVAETRHLKNLSEMMMIVSRQPELITEEMMLSLLKLVHRDARDENGYSLLLFACFNPGALSTVRLLVKLGANLNVRDNFGDGVLHHLAENPASKTRDETAQLLVDLGAHLDMVNKDGMTAADVWFQTHASEKKDVADLPDWLQEGVPKLTCLSSRVIRRHKLPYDDGAIVPAVLIPFVSLH